MVVSSVTPLMAARFLRVPAGLRGDATLDGGEEDALLLAGGLVEDGDVGLGAGAEVEEQGGIPAVVEDHVRVPAVGPLEDLMGVFPVLLEGLALIGIDGDAGVGDGGGGMILGREDVARGPADLGTEGLERLDQDGRLDGHVERAGDARALEGLARGILLADGHEAGHLGLGDRDLAAAPGGQRDVGDVVIADSGRLLQQRRSRSKSPKTMNGRRCTVIIHPIEPGRNAHACRRSAPRRDGFA